jgi:peroxiredoxin
MKKIILIAGIALMIFSACQEEEKVPNYTISGRVIDAQGDNVYLARLNGNDAEYLDTAQMVNGKFEMIGSIDVPENLYLLVGDEDHYFPIFLSNDKIEITTDFDSLDQAEISGAPYQAELEKFSESLEPINKQKDQLYENYKAADKNGDQAEMDEIDSQWETLEEKEKDAYIQYVVANPNSPIAPYNIRRKIYYFDLADLEEMDPLYGDAISDSPYLIYIRERIAGLKIVAIGNKYVDFAMVDTSGNEISISDQDGKYRLVDFWASWCGPCRAENPNLVKEYNKYKNKNFTVIGVSFDNNGDKWKQAIVDDNLDWAQMSDLKGWGSAAGKIYMINSIPSNVLINPDGIIIDKNLRGKDLRNKLAELFGE